MRKVKRASGRNPEAGLAESSKSPAETSTDRAKAGLAKAAQSNPMAFWKSVAKFQRLR